LTHTSQAELAFFTKSNMRMITVQSVSKSNSSMQTQLAKTFPCSRIAQVQKIVKGKMLFIQGHRNNANHYSLMRRETYYGLHDASISMKYTPPGLTYEHMQ